MKKSTPPIAEHQMPLATEKFEITECKVEPLTGMSDVIKLAYTLVSSMIETWGMSEAKDLEKYVAPDPITGKAAKEPIK